MRAGVGVLEYWDLTLGEIKLVLETYRDTQQQAAEEKLSITYNQAVMIADFVNLRFNGKQLPSFNEVFPNLAQNKMSEKEKKELEYKQAMFLKEQMMFAAKQHNAKRRKNNGGDGLSR